MNISFERIHDILFVYLDMKKIAVNWIPKCLKVDQKLKRVNVSRSTCVCFERNADFLIYVITDGEIWVHFYDTEANQQSMELKHTSSPSSKKCLVQKCTAKILASVF